MSEAQCIVQDVKCTDKCDSKGVFEKLCYAVCDARLKACKDQVPSGPPDVRVGGNKAPVNTRFPGGRPASGVPPRANTNVGGNKQTLGGSSSILGSSSTNAGASLAAGHKPVTTVGPGLNAISSPGLNAVSGVRAR